MKQDPSRGAGLQQGVFADFRQGQRQALAQAVEQLAQLEITKVAAAGVQRQAGGLVDDGVAMAPGEQFAELPRAFQRGEVGPFLAIQIAAVERPLGFVAVLAHGAMDQGQAVFGEVRGDARVDVFNLAGLALEGRVQDGGRARPGRGC